MKLPINKIAKSISLLVVFVFALSYFSHLVYNAAIEGRKSGLLAGYLTDFAQFPDLITKTLNSDELAGIPPTYKKADSSFQEVNKLTYPVYALNSFWDAAKDEWEIRLFNLKNDSTSFQWRLSKKNLDMSTTFWLFPNSSPRSCIILPNKSLLLSADESANLLRLDSNSHVLWANHQFVYHHSLELDADSNVWACGSAPIINGKIALQAVKNLESIHKYNENYIVQIDSKTGKILFQKGISEILRDNHYPNFIFGFSDPNGYANDPFHLNDIQPVLTDSPYWKKGDVFISIRHRSLVFLYRPSTNKIIRLIFGEFINQHDVDVISDSEIAVFNNNHILRGKDKSNGPEDTYSVSDTTMNSSEIVVYNFKDSTFKTLLKQHFTNEKIISKTQGGYTFLKNKDIFVESQNQGKLFIVNDSGVVLKKILRVPSSPFIYQPNWIRIYEQLPY